MFDTSFAHQLIGESLLLCFRGGMFLFPRLISFNICYDLDIWAQGQGLRSFFTGMCLPLFGQVYNGDFDHCYHMSIMRTTLLHVNHAKLTGRSSCIK